MLEMIFNSDNYNFINPYSIANLLTGAILLFLGSFIIYKDPRKANNFIIGFFSLAAAWWQLFFFLSYNTATERLAFLLFKLGFIGVIFLLPSAFHIGFILLKNLRYKVRYLFYMNYAIAIAVSVLLLATDLILDFPIEHFWGYYTTAGKLFTPYLVYLFFFLSSIIIILAYHLIRRREMFNEQEYKQLLLFFIGFFICSFGVGDFMPNFGLEIYPYGHITFTAFALIITYGIIKYNMFDIETVFHKTIAWGVMSVIVLIPAFIYISLNVEYLRTLSVPALLFFVTIVFYVDAYLRSKIQPRIDYIFQRKMYKNEEALAQLNGSLFNSDDLEAMGVNLIAGIHEILFPRRSCLFLMRDGEFRLQACHPKNKKNGAAAPVAAVLLAWMAENKKLLYRNQVLADNENFTLKGRRLEWPEKEWAVVLVPIVFKNEIIGLIVLDKKESLRDYDISDLRLLETIAKDASMAINNFIRSEKLVVQERTIKQDLQAEVEKQTRELKDKNLELKKFNDVAVDRELKMIELKNRIEELEKLTGRAE